VSSSVRAAPRGWWVMLGLATAIALYGLRFLVVGLEAFGTDLHASFSQRPWAIWAHLAFGPVALVTGAVNFRHAIRRTRPALHRRIGQAYVIAALGTGVAGGYLALYAQGGLNTTLGFGGLAVATLTTVTMAWRYAVARDLKAHRRWMIRSYAMILAAVTLRIELPLVANYLNGFLPAYNIIAWLSWVPNLIVAEWIARRTKHPA
jgi:uncharacterized membrane protein